MFLSVVDRGEGLGEEEEVQPLPKKAMEALVRFLLSAAASAGTCVGTASLCSSHHDGSLSGSGGGTAAWCSVCQCVHAPRDQNHSGRSRSTGASWQMPSGAYRSRYGAVAPGGGSATSSTCHQPPSYWSSRVSPTMSGAAQPSGVRGGSGRSLLSGHHSCRCSNLPSPLLCTPLCTSSSRILTSTCCCGPSMRCTSASYHEPRKPSSLPHSSTCRASSSGTLVPPSPAPPVVAAAPRRSAAASSPRAASDSSSCAAGSGSPGRSQRHRCAPPTHRRPPGNPTSSPRLGSTLVTSPTHGSSTPPCASHTRSRSPTSAAEASLPCRHGGGGGGGRREAQRGSSVGVSHSQGVASPTQKWPSSKVTARPRAAS